MTITDLAAALAGLDLDALGNEALAAQANVMAELVREVLSFTSGESHVYPWKQNGSLQQSIAVTAEAGEAAIGSADPVAAWQEQGTARIPPRPFLAPVAATAAAPAAEAIGAAIAAAIGGL